MLFISILYFNLIFIVINGIMIVKFFNKEIVTNEEDNKWYNKIEEIRKIIND
jgi:hypothetical protein